MMNRPLPLALAASVALIVLSGCATNPVSGRRQFSLVSTQQELRIGTEGRAAVLAEYGAYDDARIAAYVDSVGQGLARVSHLPTLKFTFTVLDDPTVNAFAMPGGYIYITRGILAYLNSEAQLAGVLGHEIGHVTARHTAQQLTQQQLAGFGLSLASAFSSGFRQYSAAAEQALGLVFLKYSRDDETQADELGVEYSTKAGYDPREIPGTYAMLKRVSDRAGQRLPGFLSTHPDPGNREQRTRELAAAAVYGKTGLEIRTRSYLARTDQIVFGRDPRQGYAEGDRYYHPQLGFQIALPAGWTIQDSHRGLSALEPQQHAEMDLSLADAGAFGPADFVTELLRRGSIADARGAPETIGGYEAWVGHVAVAGTGGTTTTLIAAFVRRGPQSMLQLLGRSAAAGDEDETRIVTSVRSLRPLTDPGRLRATPDRVSVVRVPAAGTLGELLPRFPAQAIDAEGTSILNNLQTDEQVLPGQSLKIVVAGKLR
jgi:predicted Zn-dependent protease